MATEVDKIETSKGKICSENVLFSGLEMDRGIFTTKTRTMLRQEDGSYIANPEGRDGNGIYYQTEEQTAQMMQDTFTVLDSEGNHFELNGKSVFQWIAQAMDKNYADGYPIPEVITEDEI